MDEKHGIKISVRDRVLRVWENTMELVRSFELYSQEILREDKNTARLFERYANEEGIHAAELLKILHAYEEKNKQ